MPAQRPRASFDPISPDFNVKAFVESTPNFAYVDRITADLIDEQGLDAFERLVRLHVIVGGKPLIVEGYDERLDEWAFSAKWLTDNHGDKVENARNLTDQTNLPLTIGHYISNMRLLANQYFELPENYQDKKRQRIYLKDIDCPKVWETKLQALLPQALFYLNESTGVPGGPGSIDEVPAGGGARRRGQGIAGAGDLMSSLPPAMRAENLMCYIGHEGTYTPAHREMCASLGHNIMVEASGLVGDEGVAEKPGSSLWFMTESRDRHVVAEYWLSALGHDIEVEDHFAQIAAWKSASFNVYVAEQKPGDFILIPPLAPHQVWNRGTRTMKVAWNRTTVETLEMAMNEALPNARLVCRDEQYKNKAIIYYTMNKYSSLLARYRDQLQTAPTPQAAAALKQSTKISRLRKDFKRLFNLYKEIVLSEMFPPNTSHNPKLDYIPYDSNVTCAYCRGNIFNRFLSCPTCEYALDTAEAEPYDICMECYAMGRSCACISNLKWVEQWKWKELIQKYETWRRQYLELEKEVTPESPQSIKEECRRMGKKSLAQVCQEQLKKRPWVDISKGTASDGDEESEENEEIEMNEDGTVKKSKKRRSEAWLKTHHTCHVCCHRHEKWKTASCSCGRSWCYGTLFRAFDLMPQTVMEDLNWICPHCKGICSAGACKKSLKQNPYQPKGTLLGHDTKRIADARSVESLVDFSVSNLTWLNESANTPDPLRNQRLARKQQDANTQPDQPHDSDNESQDAASNQNQIMYSPALPIDPLLVDTSQTTPAQNLEPSQKTVQARNVPDISALLNATSPPVETRPDPSTYDMEHPGYQPAIQRGYHAGLGDGYRSHQQGEYETELYPESVLIDVERALSGLTPAQDSVPMQETNGMKGIKLAQNKRRRKPAEERASIQERVPSSGASRHYRKEKEKKQLEEARKKGAFIMTSAKLKGKSLNVKFQLGPELLSSWARREQNRSCERPNGLVQPDVDSNVLLRSDVLPPPENTSAVVPDPTTAASPKSSNAVRIRVEPDEDFVVRKRGRRSRGNHAPNKKAASAGFEELDLDSDSDTEERSIHAANRKNGLVAKKKRKISQWQAQKHMEDGDSELVEGLPDGWKDGYMKVRRKASTSHDSGSNIPENQTQSESQAKARINGRSPCEKQPPPIPPTTSGDESATEQSNASSDGPHDAVADGGTHPLENETMEENEDDEMITVKPVASRASILTPTASPQKRSFGAAKGNANAKMIAVSPLSVRSIRGSAASDHPASFAHQQPPKPLSLRTTLGPGGRRVKIVSGLAKKRAAVAASEVKKRAAAAASEAKKRAAAAASEAKA